MSSRTLGRGPGVGLLVLAALAAACGKTEPMGMEMDPPMLSADVEMIDFGTLDVAFGAGQAMTVTVTNDGSEAVSVTAPSIDGAAAADFAIASGGSGTMLAAGASLEVTVAFDPSDGGNRQAALTVATDGDPMTSVTVDLNGSGGVFQYAQVDRKGIPGLNTVFNHPPAFSKTDYNVASLTNDLADYTGLFETVLGAVGNADPSATAALLLPDALPVSLAAQTSQFAMLTGRDLADDAVDVALFVVVGDASLHSDNVDENDREFLAAFPYLAAPHQ